MVWHYLLLAGRKQASLISEQSEPKSGIEISRKYIILKTHQMCALLGEFLLGINCRA